MSKQSDYRSIAITICVSLAIAYGCSSPTGKQEVTPERWPTAIGTQWIYSVYLPLTEEVDTLKVEIVDTISDPSGLSLGIWENTYFSDNRKDSVFVGLLSDTVFFYWSPTDSFPRWFYILDAEVGKTWSNDVTGLLSSGDYTTSLAPSKVSVPAGEFTNAATYSREMSANILGIYHDYMTWIVPDIGIVKYRHTSFLNYEADIDTVFSLISTTANAN